MFEHFNTPQELFEYRLGEALTMEQDSLDMLGALQAAAPTSKVKEMFAHHADETREQIGNLEKAFSLLRLEPYTNPSPTTKGLSKEGDALLRKTAEPLHDIVAVTAALETEHHEIGAYQALIAGAESLDAPEVAALLRHNLEQESHTSEELQTELRALIQQQVALT